MAKKMKMSKSVNHLPLINHRDLCKFFLLPQEIKLGNVVYLLQITPEGWIGMGPFLVFKHSYDVIHLAHCSGTFTDVSVDKIMEKNSKWD